MSIRILILLFFSSYLGISQNSYIVDKDYDAIISQEITWHSQKSDSVFIYNEFKNEYLYDWFNYTNNKMFDSKKDMPLNEKKALIRMAKKNDSVNNYIHTVMISTAFSDNLNVYFIESNSRIGEKKSESGTTILTKLFFIDKKRYKVTLSEPFFSEDRNYAIMFSQLKHTIGFVIYKKEEGKWIRRGYIVCSIS